MLVWIDGKMQKKPEIAHNPDAKRLADHYVPLILARLGRSAPQVIPAEDAAGEGASSKVSQNLRENGYQREVELDEEDRQALLEFPL